MTPVRSLPTLPPRPARRWSWQRSARRVADARRRSTRGGLVRPRGESVLRPDCWPIRRRTSSSCATRSLLRRSPSAGGPAIRDTAGQRSMPTRTQRPKGSRPPRSAGHRHECPLLLTQRAHAGTNLLRLWLTVSLRRLCFVAVAALRARRRASAAICGSSHVFTQERDRIAVLRRALSKRVTRLRRRSGARSSTLDGPRIASTTTSRAASSDPRLRPRGVSVRDRRSDVLGAHEARPDPGRFAPQIADDYRTLPRSDRWRLNP
jgi:hypothetical protein